MFERVKLLPILSLLSLSSSVSSLFFDTIQKHFLIVDICIYVKGNYCIEFFFPIFYFKTFPLF